MAGSVAAEHVVPLLRGRLAQPYRYVAVCASTQRLLEDAPEGAVVVTDEQTEGRGRLGRQWHAPAGTSVLMSVALEPAVPPARLPELSLVAGEAVAAAIRATAGLEPSIKHPNDVLVGGRKVAGVLAEARDGRVALGIGINVSQAPGELPPDANATSLALEGGDVDRAALVAEVLAELEERYDAWVRSAGT